MLILKTNCKDCTHTAVCRHKDNAKMMYDKLKNTNFGDGPNDDYDYDIMSDHYHVNIELGCPDYKENTPATRLNTWRN